MLQEFSHLCVCLTRIAKKKNYSLKREKIRMQKITLAVAVASAAANGVCDWWK